MKKILKISTLLLFIFIVYFLYKVYSNYTIAQKIIKLEQSTFSEYLNLFYYNYDRTPNDLKEFKSYLKSRDITLLELINKIEIEYLRNDSGHISFYHRGFDKVDDSLKITYKDIKSFFETFYIKGDIEIDYLYPYNSVNIKNNIIYKVGKNSIIKVKKLNIYKIYKDYLKCDSEEISLNNLEYSSANNVSFKINKGKIKMSDTISAGVNSYYFELEAFPESTKKIFLEYILKQRALFHKDSIYFINIAGDDIKQYNCK